MNNPEDVGILRYFLVKLMNWDTDLDYDQVNLWGASTNEGE